MTGGPTQTVSTVHRDLTSRDEIQQWPIVDTLFTIGVILATTLGPVYQIRVRLGPVDGAFADDAVVVAMFSAMYVAAAVLAIRSPRRVQPAPLSLAIVMTSLLVASTLWSIDRPLTAMHSLTALGALAIPWYLVRRWNVTQLALLAWLATSIGIGLSALAILRHRDGSIDPRGDWAGIYFNRNSLGPVAGLCLLLGLWVVVVGIPKIDTRADVTVRVVAAGSVMLSSTLLLRSASKTSLLATLATTAIAGGVIMVRVLTKGRVRRWQIGTALAMTAVLPVLLFSRITSMMGATPTLEGRTSLWGYLWDKFWEAPLTGKGWLATYSSLEYWHWGVEHLSINVYSAHNGIIEVAVGAGAIALVALLVLLWMGVDAALGGVLTDPTTNTPMLMIMTFFLIENSGETFVGANHFLWILFLAVCAFEWRSEQTMTTRPTRSTTTNARAERDGDQMIVTRPQPSDN